MVDAVVDLGGGRGGGGGRFFFRDSTPDYPKGPPLILLSHL